MQFVFYQLQFFRTSSHFLAQAALTPVPPPPPHILSHTHTNYYRAAIQKVIRRVFQRTPHILLRTSLPICIPELPWFMLFLSVNYPKNPPPPASYATRRFFTVFKEARHWFQFWARWITTTHSNPIYPRSSLILCFHLSLSLPNGLFLSRFQTKICIFLITTVRAAWPTHLILLALSL
jgi:hypothetical protein